MNKKENIRPQLCPHESQENQPTSKSPTTAPIQSPDYPIIEKAIKPPQIPGHSDKQREINQGEKKNENPCDPYKNPPIISPHMCEISSEMKFTPRETQVTNGIGQLKNNCPTKGKDRYTLEDVKREYISSNCPPFTARKECDIPAKSATTNVTHNEAPSTKPQEIKCPQIHVSATVNQSPTLHEYSTDASENISYSNNEEQIYLEELMYENFLMEEINDNNLTEPIADTETACADKEMITECFKIFDIVESSKKYNFEEAKVPVKSKLNINTWRSYLDGYEDNQLIEHLEYGFPMSYDGPLPIADEPFKNHASATMYPDHIDKFFEKNIKNESVIGPFSNPPFGKNSHPSPLMSRPKKEPGERRIIMDLSYPCESSVNKYTTREIYLGKPYKVKLPTPAQLREKIVELGPGCFMFSCDMARAYRQIRSDPREWPRSCMKWRGCWYVDLSALYGNPWSCAQMQRTTDAVRHIVAKENIDVLNYIDDIIGINRSEEKAHKQFARLKEIMGELGLELAEHKQCLPTCEIIWLGIKFSSLKMNYSIPEEKLQEILNLLETCKEKQKWKLRDYRSLLGKLLHITSICPHFRLFLNRLLPLIREVKNDKYVTMDHEAMADIEALKKIIPLSNNTAMIQRQPTTKDDILVDATLKGVGGVMGELAYACDLPKKIKDLKLPIQHLELLNILVGLRMFAHHIVNKVVNVYTDNTCAQAVIKNGKSRDGYLLKVARAIWLLLTAAGAEIIIHWIDTKSNYIADALSRYSTSIPARKIVHNEKLTLLHVPHFYFELDHPLAL